MMAARPVLDRRWYAALAAGWAAFTVYGSLVPFDYQPRPDAFATFRDVLTEGPDIDSRSDWVANCLLGVPLGFFLLGALRADTSGRGAAAATGVLVWPACVLVAVGVEFAQLYFPPRNSSASDILAQSLGSAVGIAAWLALGQRLTDAVRRAWADPRAGGAAGRVLLGYLVVSLLVQMLPLDIEVSPGKINRRLKTGYVTVVPFAELTRSDGGTIPDPWRKVQSWVELAALFLPAGLLAARLPGWWWRGWLGVPTVAVAGVAVAAVTEAAQLFVSRHPSVTDALVGGAGALLGWTVARVMGRLAAGPGISLDAAVVLGQLWFWVLLGVSWQPFDFGPARPGAVVRVPFADLEVKDAFAALDATLERGVLFLPLGVLVAAVGAVPRGGWRAVWAGVLGLVLSLVLEAGQVFLPSRYPSATDVVTAAVGAWAGAAVCRHIRVRTG